MQVRAATLADVLSLSGSMPWAQARAISLQCYRSEMAAVVDAGGLATVIGFYPLGLTPEGEQAFELWTVSRKSLSMAAVRFIVRLARVTMQRLAHACPVAVVSSTRAGWMPGRKLHALIGMHPVGNHDAGTEVFLWRSRDGQVCQAADGEDNGRAVCP